MMEIPLPSVQKLIRVLQAFPGIGPRTAQRLALYILKLPDIEARRLVEAILEARKRVHFCPRCFSLTEEDLCAPCRDPRRATGEICVVEDPINVFVIERTGIFKGRYHVLMGALAPLRGIGPEQLKIKDLLERIPEEKISEVILALNPTVEGEATAIYLSRQLKPMGIKVTRLASGIPMGADLEYIDELTLSRAFQGRTET